MPETEAKVQTCKSNANTPALQGSTMLVQVRLENQNIFELVEAKRGKFLSELNTPLTLQHHFTI